MTADEILTAVVREAIAAYKLGRRIDRHVPVSTVALALEQAARDAEAVMPTEPLHLGAVWESRGFAAAVEARPS